MMSPDSTVQFRPAIAHCLEQYARKQQILSLLRAIALAILAAIAWLTLWGVVDRFVITIPSSGRLFLLMALVLLEVTVVGRPLAGFFGRSVNWLTVASSIEAHDARFGEALLTVVSESQAPARHRASVEMVDQLGAQVEDEIRGSAHLASPPSAAAHRASGAAGIGLAIFVSLFFWPRLGMEELVARQILPMADLAPVKTTQLTVQPGSLNVPQGSSLPITATVQQLRGSTVILRTTTDNRTWATVGMTPSGNGLFTHTLPSITRDLTYQVMAGDAISEPSLVRVLRAPLVRDFRIRLVYPKYVAREPLTLTSTDGVIQAPLGTLAHIILNATEPLKSATFIVNGQRIEGRRSGDAHSWQANFPIDSDARWQVEMVSDRGENGSGPGEMPIHAIPDRPPMARLDVPDGALFLRPTDSVEIPYRAADDYALAKVEQRINVNNVAAATMPIALPADSQHVEGSFTLDLSAYKLSIGDLVSVMIAATDRAPQTTQATQCQIVISSQPVTVQQRVRVSQLRQANQLSGAIMQDLDGMQSAPEGSNLIISKIASAAESSAMLVQSLLQAGSNAQDRSLSLALAQLTDAAAVQAGQFEQLSAQLGSANLPQGWLARARDEAKQLQDRIAMLWKGESAEVISAERAGLDAARAQTDASLDNLRGDVDVELHELGIDAHSASVSSELQSQMARGKQIIDASQPIDFAAAATAWGASKEPRRELFAERLSIASRFETLRAGADDFWARDLQLSSRAVRAVDNRGPETGRSSIADEIGSLQKEHLEGISPSEILTDPKKKQIQSDAQNARNALREWIGRFSPFVSTQPAWANAGTNQSQRSIATTQETDTRERALSMIRQAQEYLAELPLQLGRIEQSVQISRQSLEIAQRADRDAQTAVPDARPAMQRAAEIAHVQSDEAFTNLAGISREIDSDQLHQLTQDLRSSETDAAPAADAIAGRLEPAVGHLRERINAREPDGIDQAIVEARSALSLCQDELRSARQAVLDKDPLVAARWFAHQQAIAAEPTSRPALDLLTNDNILLPGRLWIDSLQRQSNAHFTDPATQPALGLFDLGKFRQPWLDPDLAATTTNRDDDPPQFKDALRAYFKVLGRPDADVDP